MANPGPSNPAQQQFSTRFRGYDPAEVDERFRALSDTVATLRREQEHLTARLEQVGERDVDFAVFADELGQILQTAKDAADGLRRRATEEVSAWRAEARIEVDDQRRDAAADAESLRRDAWTEAEMLWNQAKTEIRRKLDEGEREALAIVGQAERDAHRMLSSARRESEEQLRLAKMESERLLVEARTQHEEIVDAARKAADASQERARALEVRRTELLDELETVRMTVARLESDLDAKRVALVEAAQQAAPEPEPEPEPAPEPKVRFVPGVEDGKEWPENIRIIPAGKRQEDAGVDASEMAAEVRRIRTEAETPDVAEEPAADVAEQPAKTRIDTLEVEPVENGPGDAAEPTGEAAGPGEEIDESNGSDPEPSTEVPAGSPEPDDIGGLFASLRADETPAVVVEPDEPGGDGATDDPVPVAADEPSTDALIAAPLTFDGDAADYRDQLLLPITNRILRSIKRQLTEAQNIALEEIRVTEGDWEPDVAELRERVHGDLVIVVQEAFAAGYGAVEQLTGAAVGRPKPKKSDIADHGPAFAKALAAQLAEAVGEASGPRAASAALSRAYRGWRTDEAERRVRAAARGAFHKGMARALAIAKAPALFWSVSGRGCPDCREMVEHGPVPPERGFGPDGVLPPLHDGCACTVVPGN
ncbi:MAG: DivIVA domain-containing protein [Acidimicrobiia bacterium]|nr:DivIVA domain-containing protein [Acidimicrobiia bacterium]